MFLSSRISDLTLIRTESCPKINIYAFVNRKMLAIALQLIGATGARVAINAHKELR